SRGDYERTQSMAGVSRIALCSARLVDAGNLPEFSRYKGEVGEAFKNLLLNYPLQEEDTKG
ncbi:hypothetical protein IKF81_00005, partial [Candidatus Saccharibacteria bacterium]|nr:hypothetical protein [Candidatus Saccharibacteria bacterium]